MTYVSRSSEIRRSSGCRISWLVLFDTGRLDLLEAPLRQVDVASSQVAAKVGVPQPESSSQECGLGVVPRCGVPDNLDLPVILVVTDGSVAVARNFPVGLGDGCGDCVRVQVAAGLSMDETNDIAISDEFERSPPRHTRLVSVWIEEPVVVRIFVVVAGDLLLLRALGIRLDVRVEQTAAVAHVLESRARSKCDLQWAVLANLGASKIGLEEGGHLGIARTAVLEDQEVHPEREEIEPIKRNRRIEARHIRNQPR